MPDGNLECSPLPRAVLPREEVLAQLGEMAHDWPVQTREARLRGESSEIPLPTEYSKIHAQLPLKTVNHVDPVPEGDWR